MRLVIELSRTLRALARAARRRTPSLASLRWVLVVLAVLALPAAAGAESSEWRIRRDPAGDGILLPGGLWVAGDLTVGVEVPDDGPERPALAEIDDVSLLLRYEPTSRFSIFSELRLEDLVDLVEAEGVHTGDVEFAFERLYAEALLTPALTLRVGKVFTPFGLWNVTHRAPLTWTVDEPAVTDRVFPKHATGFSLLYRTTWHGWSFDATAYGPAQDELKFQRSDEEEDGWLTGTRLAAGRSVGGAFGSLGVNVAGFRSHESAAWVTATGLDLEVTVGGHQVMGELTYRIPEAGGRTAHGLYLQDVIPLEPLSPRARNFYGVVRFEHFRPDDGSAAVGGLVGVFWRPLPSVILRADYLFANRTLDNLEPGFHGAISLLF